MDIMVDKSILANVNHMLSVVCLSSVTLVRPTQAVEIFGNIYTAFESIPWPSPDIHRKFYSPCVASPVGNSPREA